MDIINRLIDLNALAPQIRFEEYINDLLAGHDIAEMASMLVRYIKSVEEDICISLRKQILDLRITNLNEDIKIEQILDGKSSLEQEYNELKSKIDKISYKRSRVNKKKQLEIRESDGKDKKSK